MRSYIKKINNVTALTLTELLVSCVLMGVVMVGIAGYSATVKRMYDTTDKQTILAMQAASAVASVERNASMSFGFQDTTNPNFSYVQNLANPISYWSFRADPNNTPTIYTDDVWSITYKWNAGANQYDLYTCFQQEGVGPGLGSTPDVAQAPCGVNRIRMLGNSVQAFSINRVIDPSPSALDMYVEVTLTASTDPASFADDPLDDPAFTITTRIPMTSHSWN